MKKYRYQRLKYVWIKRTKMGQNNDMHLIELLDHLGKNSNYLIEN